MFLLHVNHQVELQDECLVAGGDSAADAVLLLTMLPELLFVPTGVPTNYGCAKQDCKSGSEPFWSDLDPIISSGSGFGTTSDQKNVINVK